jgi:hypothetical protein
MVKRQKGVIKIPSHFMDGIRVIMGYLTVAYKLKKWRLLAKKLSRILTLVYQQTSFRGIHKI